MGLMGAAKPLASLSSGLLARKGQARPAMRPQGFSEMPPVMAPLDDLGWNDMGGVAAAITINAPAAPPIDPPAALPPVLVERAVLRTRVETQVEMADVAISLATAERISRESAAMTASGKAAFTLRLDADRHLRLRLASAVANRSAQALVMEALDAFLAKMPMVETLAGQIPPMGTTT